MTSPPSHLWLNALLQALQFSQSAVLHALYALGITDDIYGAPAWPWDVRIAGENLVIDVALARQFAWMLAAIAFVLACVLLAIVWRRAWRWLLIAAVAAVAIAPWPSPSLWLTAAVPTSFHSNPTGFTVQSISRGERVYTAQCAACHGADGRGEGPLADTLRRWPPTMASALLGRRADGELFWHVLYGMRDDQGVTMPAFAGRLSEREIWGALDYMRVLSASAGMAAGGSWPVPIGLPALAVKCANAPARDIAAWRATQRVRVVAVDATHPAPFEDPRFVTLLVTEDGQAPRQTLASTGLRKVAARRDDAAPATVTPLYGARADCVADTPGAWQVFAQIAGTSPSRLAGTEWLADRDGWLRALAPAGRRGWADGGLMCTTSTNLDASPRGTPTAMRADPLSATLREIDDDPVRFVKGGFVH